jgi:glycerophosphoryl diester phosphodiesterase
MPSNKPNSIWKISLQRLRLEWRQVFATHLTFTALGVILFAPLVSVVGRLLLSLSNQPALADQDIAWFLISPTGIMVLVCLVALSIAILGFELAVLMVMGAGRAQGLSITTLAALQFTTSRLHNIYSFAVGLVVRVLLLTLPFLAVGGAIAWALFTEYDINYYLSERPSEFWIAAAVIGLLALAMFTILVRKLLAWSMALPLLLFGGVAPRRSFSESERLMGEHKYSLIKVLANWALLTMILGVAVTAAIQQLGSWVVPNFFDSIKWLVPILGGFIALWMLGNFVITAFTAGALAFVLVGFYEQYGSSEESAGLYNIAHEQPKRSWKLSTPALGLVLAGAAVIAIMVGNWLLNGIQISDTVTVVAHRGAAGSAPENTLASIRQAIADSTDWVEIDVQESADGQVVVIHDSDFMKLAGIPTLTELLEEAKGKSRVVIELKYYGYDKQLEQRVVDIVEQVGMTDEVAIMSLKYEGIQRIRALRPSWTVGLLSSTAIGNLAGLDVDFLAVSRGMPSLGFVRRSHDQGKQVFVWTINDAVTMSRMMSLGVDGIITDEPALAREVILDRADLNPAERLLMHTAILFGKPEPQRRYRDDSP